MPCQPTTHVHEKSVKPPALRPGATIKIISPSTSTTTMTGLSTAVKFIQEMGFKVVLSKSMTKESTTRFLTSGDTTRTAELENAFRSDSVDGIMVLQGGAGSIDILSKIDYDVVKDHPKVFIGYSDITLLQLAFMRKAHMNSFQGPMLIDLTDEDNDTRSYNWSTLIDIVSRGEVLKLKAPSSGNWSRTVVEGKARGVLQGGNLSVYALVANTSYMPDAEDSILFFEDVNVEPWMVDNLLSSLVLRGTLKKAKGLFFGEFPNYALEGALESHGASSYLSGNLFVDDYIKSALTSTIADTLTNKIGSKPSFIEFSCCHGKYITTMPMGIRVELNAEERSVQMLENAVD